MNVPATLSTNVTITDDTADAHLATAVLAAWRDYCRDKGLL